MPKGVPNSGQKRLKYNPGQMFGDILFLERYGKNEKGDFMGLFRCHCGNDFIKAVERISGFSCHSCGCSKTWNKKPYGESLYNSAISKITSHMKKRGIECTLSKELLLDIIKKPCSYCGDSGSNTSANKSTFCKTLMHNGIDRIDSSKGYIEGNCVPCCKRCNWAKSDMTVSEFKKHIARIYKFLNLQ